MAITFYRNTGCAYSGLCVIRARMDNMSNTENSNVKGLAPEQRARLVSGGPNAGRVAPAAEIEHGSDEHLAQIGAPWSWHLLHGVDRADMLAFGRACMEAERKRIADECNERARKLTHYERTAPADQWTQARAARSALLDVATVVCATTKQDTPAWRDGVR